MKAICLSLLIALFSLGLAAQDRKKDTLQLKSQKDSTEYELLIFDAHFDSWFVKNKKPKEFYSLSYYHLKNSNYVVHWNVFYNSGSYSNVVESYIDYDQNANYDLELEYMLYYYFKYIEEVYKIKLH